MGGVVDVGDEWPFPNMLVAVDWGCLIAGGVLNAEAVLLLALLPMLPLVLLLEFAELLPVFLRFFHFARRFWNQTC